jgi:hypothetical protein
MQIAYSDIITEREAQITSDMEASRTPKIFLPSLLSVARSGTLLVERITHYLSTIPTPVDILEDLASIVGVTAALLGSLDHAILKYPLPAADKLPFVPLLCFDVELAFEQLQTHFNTARKEKVFEPNEKGLVRTPRFAWFEIMGGEGKAAGLRSRLCVEKYRVRVLIDAVRYKGLSVHGFR